MDARLKHDSGCIVIGPSKSGKTVWCKQLIKHANEIFDIPINKVYWYFGIWSIGLLDFNNDTNVFVREGMPASPSEIEPNSLVVIDDQLEGDFNIIFAKWVHHIPCFCIKITQNLYHNSKCRTTNLNAQYFVLFKYPGDKLLVRTLGNQMCLPWLVDAFENVTSNKPYRYLLIDLHQTTPEDIRVRTNVLPGEGMITVYRGRKRKIGS